MKICYEALTLEEATYLLNNNEGYFDADKQMIVIEDEQE